MIFWLLKLTRLYCQDSSSEDSQIDQRFYENPDILCCSSVTYRGSTRYVF